MLPVLSDFMSTTASDEKGDSSKRQVSPALSIFQVPMQREKTIIWSISVVALRPGFQTCSTGVSLLSGTLMRPSSLFLLYSSHPARIMPNGIKR